MAEYIFNATSGNVGYVQSIPSATYPPASVQTTGGSFTVETSGGIDGTDYRVIIGVVWFSTTLASGLNVNDGALLLTLNAKTDDDSVLLAIEHYPSSPPITSSFYSTSANSNAALVVVSDLSVGVEEEIPLTNAHLNIPPSGLYCLRFMLLVDALNNTPPTDINIITALLVGLRLKVNASSVERADQLSPASDAYDRTEAIPFTFRHNDALSQPMTAYDWRSSTDGINYDPEIHVVSSVQSGTFPADTFPAGQIWFQVRTYVGTDFGAWSNAASFLAGGPVDVPVVTGPSGVVTVATPTVTWTSSETLRQAFYVKVTNSAGTIEYYNSDRIEGNDLSYVIPSALPDDSSLKAWVAVEDEDGIQSAYDDISFTTAFDPVPVPIINVLPVDAILDSNGNTISFFGEQFAMDINVTCPDAEEGESPIETVDILRSFDNALWTTVLSNLTPTDGNVHAQDFSVPCNSIWRVASAK